MADILKMLELFEGNYDFAPAAQRDLDEIIATLRATPPADAALADELDCVASELATYQSDNAATVSRAAAALRARQPAQAVAVPDADLWSFLRNVLQQGAAIAADHADKHYELYCARLEAAAKERKSQLLALLAASKGGAT